MTHQQGLPPMTSPSLLLVLLGLLRPLPAHAGEGYWYLVAKETKDDEQFVLSGAHGTFLCSSTTYCFGLDEGDKTYWSKNPLIAVNEEIFYDNFERSCKVWDCEQVAAPTPTPRPVDTSSQQPDAASPAAPRASGSPSGGCIESSIKEPQPFLGNSGEVVVLNDGSVWTVDLGEYNYLYEYYASVTVCGSKMMVGGKSIPVSRVR